MYDWIGKKMGVPLYKFFSAEKAKVIVSTFAF